ncbi:MULTISPECIES: CSS-motif domain-containing protein [Pseudomonas]|uniref:CSS-motif domain-containing protein n=1 Tax=Pseudomonas eucalypticola TaxID=2599595 RepID=A0A7D5DA54_9PSED|nr:MULTISPECIES: CSS-motif domain-containing protein [Pseudomonas]QKZ05201.1 CSS-motif domain-containing protein [Pseudomonas eucalypticola]
MPHISFSADGLRAVLAATLIGLLPVASGLLVLHWQVERNLRDEVRHTTAEAIRQLDVIIAQAAQSAERLLPLAGEPCESVLHQVRQEVTIEPFVRSANLVRDHQGYCSSFYGAYQRPVSQQEYFNGRLLLRASNPVTPDEASLVYRLYNHPHGVRTVIDGRTLASALRMIEGHAVLVLQVGEAFLWSDSSVRGGDIPDHPEHHTLLTSKEFGYQVHGGFAPGYGWGYLKRQAFATLGGLLLLGIATGGVCHWLYRRRQG